MTKSPLALVLASLVVLAACGSPEQSPPPPPPKAANFDAPMAPVLMPDVVSADQHFADDVVVSDDRLVVPTAGHEKMLAKIKVGSVLAGNRSSRPLPANAGLPDANGVRDYGPNPYGFLRRVTSMKTDGANTVLVTTKATLDDYLAEGDLVFGGTKSGSPSSVKTKTLKLLDDDEQEGSGSGSASVEINASLGDNGVGVKLSDASIKLDAKFDGYFKVRYRPTPAFPDPPTGVSFKSVLTLDPEFIADIEVSGSAESERDKMEWRGPGLLVPLPSPVPVTLRLEPEIECSITISGSTSYGFNVRIGAHSVDGYEGDAGLDHFDLSDLSEPATISGGLTLKSIQAKATGTVTCALRAVPALLLFDALGIEGKIGPYVSANAEVCRGTNANGTAVGFTLFEEHGLTGELDGRVKIPLVNVGKSFKGLGIDVPVGRNYLIGDENSCDAKAIDSCVGKADGLYCSEVAPYAGYICRAGQIDGGLQCAAEQKCTGGTAEAIECQ